MDKWLCLRVIIDFVFEQHQAVFHFVQMPFDVAKPSVLGCALPSFAHRLLYWCRIETNECIHVAVFVIYIYIYIYFQRTGGALPCPVCFFLHWQMLYSIKEAIQHCTLQICFLAYTSLFSIKSNVLKLDTVQKVYSVNKGLFLGVFSSLWFVYMGRYRDTIYLALVNYAKIFYD